MQSPQSDLSDLLIPTPKKIELSFGVVKPFRHLRISGRQGDADLRRVVGRLGIEVVDADAAYSFEVHRGSVGASGVQADCSEAYHLELLPEKATLKATTEQGIRNGVATFLQVARILQRGALIRAAVIDDWPDMTRRGIFMEDKWGSDLMGFSDWKELVDFLAAYKLNVLGVGLYGCWCVQYRGEVTEFLMVPVPGRPELQTEKTIVWYSPREGRWESATYLPRMYCEDFFGALVAYGRTRGVNVIPFVNSLGHNTLFPRLVPEISARDASGRPTGYGYCLSSPQTWEFITSLYGSIADRYLLPNASEFFHIQMDEIYTVIGADPADPKKTVDPECKCAACQSTPVGTRIQEYIIRLATFLCERGMQNVVIWNDQLTRHMDLVDDAFVERLKAGGIYDNVVLHWWWYDNQQIHERVNPKLGRGLRGWVGPMTCYYNWSYYRINHPNIAKMLAMGHATGAEGAVSYSTYDPSCDFDFALLAQTAWNADAAQDPEVVDHTMSKFARLTCEAEAQMLVDGLRALELASMDAVVRNIVYYTYTYPATEREYPRPYPLEALQGFEGGRVSLSDLQTMQRWASHAREGLDLLAERCPDAMVRNLRVEALRFEALATVFIQLLQVRKTLAQNPATGELEGQAQLVQNLSGAFLIQMGVVENDKPAYMLPSVLRDLSVLYEFLLQLSDDLKQATVGSIAVDDVRWYVEPCCAQRR